MLIEFPMPDIGEGVAEGEVTQWLVAEGDVITADQPMVEVMTDKATVEIPAPCPGKVVAILVEEGATVPVGAYLLNIELAEGAQAPKIVRHGDHDDSAPAAAAPAPAPAPPPAPAPAPAPVVAAPSPAPAPVAVAQRPAGQRALATPATRRLAREKGVDIELIPGTGPAGRVSDDDVVRFSSGTTATPTPVSSPAAITPVTIAAQAPAQGDQVVPIRGMRKRIYERMMVSKNTAAHFTYVDDLDVTELVEIRKIAKERAKLKGAKLTYLPFIMKAIVEAFRQFPTLNSVVDDAAGTYTVRGEMNFGIAVDTDAGLMVPVVKHVDRLSLIQLAIEIERVATDARNGKSRLEDLQGGTFTITNAGNIGGLFATPVINYPECAILGVHKIQKTPRVVNDRIVPRDVMYLSVSIDHRINDGATGARWMNVIKEHLEDPKRILVGEI
ncbi:MAG: dihydrolipoamide acetyltransferase family protein [Planctomycetota bacterium]|jgi:pyruvate dehydrogenase E2 component (dihydrolipoamide acetyltransferase)